MIPPGSAAPLTASGVAPFQGAVDQAVATGNVAPLDLTDLAGLFQNSEQFGQNLQLQVDQFNAGNELRVAEANQAARLRVAELNASLRAQQGQFAEQVRQFDIQDARERENMRFLLRKQQVATEEGNRAAMQNAVALQEQISSRLENNRFQRQQLVTEVQGINAQIENNVRVFNAQEKARVEQLNEQRRQANLQQLQSVSSQIGELARNPADVGKLAAFLRSGNAAPISSAIARGDNAITDESLLGLRGLLGVRDGLQQGPTQATANLIEANLINEPQFGELGQAPEIDQLFTPVVFDPSGIAAGPSPAAGDPGEFFQPVVGPGDIVAPGIGLPVATKALGINSPTTGGGSAPGPQAIATGGGATRFAEQPTSVPEGFQIAGNSQVPVAPPQSFEEALEQTQATGSARAQTGATQEQLQQLLKAALSPENGGTFDPTGGSLAVGGLARGGVARPGQPVIVGDSSDGKENQELAVVDAQGNLVVVPLDRLPRAEEGGLFRTNGMTRDDALGAFERRQSAGETTPEEDSRSDQLASRAARRPRSVATSEVGGKSRTLSLPTWAYDAAMRSLRHRSPHGRGRPTATPLVCFQVSGSTAGPLVPRGSSRRVCRG